METFRASKVTLRAMWLLHVWGLKLPTGYVATSCFWGHIFLSLLGLGLLLYGLRVPI